MAPDNYGASNHGLSEAELSKDEPRDWPFSNESLVLLAHSRNEKSPRPMPFLINDAMQDVVRTRAFWITRRRPDDLLRSLSETWSGDVELNGEVCCSSGKTIRTMFAKFDCLEPPRQRHFVYIADVDMLIASKIAAKNYAASKPKEMQRQELKKMKEDEDYRPVLVSSLRNEINEQKDKQMFG